MSHFNIFRSHTLMILLLLSSLSLCGCENPQKPEANTPLTLGILPDVESIPLVLAEKNGYFEQTGANIQLEIFKSARDRDSALQGNQLDGVITDMVAVVFAQAGGIPLKITAQTDGNILLLASPNSGITTLSELQGKEAALSANTVMEYSLDQMLTQANLDPASIIKTAIPQLPTRLEMLQNGQLDAAILPQPLAGIALKSGAKLLCDTQQLGEKAGVIAFTATALEEKPEVIQAFFTAYNQAVEELNQAEPGTYDTFFIETLGFPESLQGELTLPDYQSAHLPKAEIFEHVMDWMQKQQLLSTRLTFEEVSVNLFPTES